MSDAIIIKNSPFGFDETLARIEGAAREAGNTIFARIDQAAAARGAGLTLRPTVALIFGNPKGGTPLMAASPAFALELPLKVVVWQDADGPVKFAYRSLRALAATNPLPSEDEALATLDERLASMLDTALR